MWPLNMAHTVSNKWFHQLDILSLSKLFNFVSERFSTLGICEGLLTEIKISCSDTMIRPWLYIGWLVRDINTHAHRIRVREFNMSIQTAIDLLLIRLDFSFLQLLRKIQACKCWADLS